MAEWSFFTNHARVLLCISRDPGIRLQDIATGVGITERSAFGIVNGLADSGYIVKERDGRRNRYEIQHQLPLLGAESEERTIGELLNLLAETTPGTAQRKKVAPPTTDLTSRARSEDRATVTQAHGRARRGVYLWGPNTRPVW